MKEEDGWVIKYNMKAAAKWVKVTDQLPEENVSVLVFIPEEDGHITTGMWDVSKKWVLLDEYRVPICQVTYWIPMVEPPEDKMYIPTNKKDDELLTSNIIRNLQKKLHQAEADKIEYGRKKWEEGCDLMRKEYGMKYAPIPEFKP